MGTRLDHGDCSLALLSLCPWIVVGLMDLYIMRI